MDDPEFVRFAEIAKAMDLPLQIVTRGAVLEFGRVRAEVLAPESSENPNAPSANNDSLVLRLKYGDRVFLLTGDMEKESESQVLTSNERLDCDVVKVAHHGSNTSSTPEFVAATHARFAVISVGLRSPFGHPVPAIVDRWKASGAQTLTTGENGTISFSTDGHDLRLSTFAGTPDFR
jgi:competence protein ComEC